MDEQKNVAAPLPKEWFQEVSTRCLESRIDLPTAPRGTTLGKHLHVKSYQFLPSRHARSVPFCNTVLATLFALRNVNVFCSNTGNCSFLPCTFVLDSDMNHIFPTMAIPIDHLVEIVKSSFAPNRMANLTEDVVRDAFFFIAHHTVSDVTIIPGDDNTVDPSVTVYQCLLLPAQWLADAFNIIDAMMNAKEITNPSELFGGKIEAVEPLMFVPLFSTIIPQYGVPFPNSKRKAFGRWFAFLHGCNHEQFDDFSSLLSDH